ncbi:apolipoprotein M [Pholidichthys leucotaenia]
MLNKALSFFLSLSTLLYQVLVPCPTPELLNVKAVDRQKYLGTWYFKVAVSHREADIAKFKALDNIRFTMEEVTNETLLLTGHMRMGDTCVKQTWTYHLKPDRDDLELEGRTHRINLLWTGKWANCDNCIVFQEIEPPLDRMNGSEDSLHRHMLYSRHSDMDSKRVAAFEKNAACHNMRATVRPTQQKEICT